MLSPPTTDQQFVALAGWFVRVRLCAAVLDFRASFHCWFATKSLEHREPQTKGNFFAVISATDNLPNWPTSILTEIHSSREAITMRISFFFSLRIFGGVSHDNSYYWHWFSNKLSVLKILFGLLRRCVSTNLRMNWNRIFFYVQLRVTHRTVLAIISSYHRKMFIRCTGTRAHNNNLCKSFDAGRIHYTKWTNICRRGNVGPDWMILLCMLLMCHVDKVSTNNSDYNSNQ